MISGIVRILHLDGSTVGAGFVVSANGLIATCAHVVRDAGGQPGSTVRIVLHVLGQELVAAVEPAYWREPDAEDVAILRLEAPLPEQVQPLPLGHSAQIEGKTLKTFGFPDAAGRLGEAHVLGAVKRNSTDVLQLRSPEITCGFSGAPVWDEATEYVIGMVDSVARPDAVGRGTETAFITPSERLAAVCPALQLTQAVDPREQKLADYRQWVLEETQFVNLRGIPLPKDRTGRPVALNVPLDKVYIRIQAIEEKQQRTQEKSELREVEGRISAKKPNLWGHKETTSDFSPAGLPNPAGTAGFGNPAGAEAKKPNLWSRFGLGRQDQGHVTDHDPLTSIRALGEYLYRRGEVYQSARRPDPINPEEALGKNKRIVILGAPGAGKSTLLRYLARHAAQDPASPVPILVSLRDYATALSSNQDLSLPDFALAQASRGNARLRRTLEEAIEREQALWLVDALDEARDWAEKAAQQANRLPGRLVVTSRPIGYHGAALQSMSHFEVLPLSPQDVDQFFRDWFGVLAEPRQASPGWVEGRVAWLKGQLEQHPRIQPLVRNPLLLTFLVILTGENRPQELPEHRAELYRRYVEELMDSWETRRHSMEKRGSRDVFRLGPLVDQEAREAARLCFYYLGWQLHLLYYGGQTGQLPTRSALATELTTYLPGKWAQSSSAIADAAIDFWMEAGLFDTWRLGQNEYLAIRHLTFQEYAAAWGLAQVWGRNPEEAWAFLRPRLHHYAWREPLLLLTGILSAQHLDDLVRRLLKGSSPRERLLHRDLRLAGAFVGEGAPMDTRLSASVIHRLGRSSRNPMVQYRLVFLSMLCVMLLFPFSPEIGNLVLGWSNLPHEGQNAVAIGMPIYLLGCYAWMMVWALIATGRISWPVAPAQRLLIEALGQTRDERAAFYLARSLWDAKVSEQAAQALVQIGAPVVPHLCDELNHYNADIRRIIIDLWYGRIKRIATLEQGTRQLWQTIVNMWAYPWVGWSAGERLLIQVIGRIGDPRAVPELVLATQDPNYGIQRASAVALGQIGDDAAVPALIHAPQEDHDSEMEEVWARLGSSAVPDLVQLLSDTHEYIRDRAVRALERMGDPDATLALVSPFLDYSYSDWWIVAQALDVIVKDQGSVPVSLRSRIKDRVRSKPGLMMALQSGSVFWRRDAARVLQDIGDLAVLDILNPLREFDTSYSWTVQVLDEHEIRTIPDLVQALQHPEVRVRRASVMILELTRDIQAAPGLILALHDPDPAVRQAVAWALGQVGYAKCLAHPVPSPKETDTKLCAGEIAAPGQSEFDQVMQALIGALNDADNDVRKAVAEALEQIGTPAVPVLVWALESDSSRRQEIVRVLGKINDGLAVIGINHVLRDVEERIYQAAQWAFAQAEANRPVSSTDRERHAVIRVVHRLRALVTPPLLWVLDNKGGYWGGLATFALAWVGDERAVLPVIRQWGGGLRFLAFLIGADPLHFAAWVLGQIGVSAIPHLVEALHEPAPQLRYIATLALSRIQDVRAMPGLVLASQDTDAVVRNEAMSALGELEGGQAVLSLAQTKQDPQDSFRKVAVSSIRRIDWSGRDVSSDVGSQAAWQALPLVVYRRSLHDADARIRRLAAFALGCVGNAHAALDLIATLHDPEQDVVEAAIEALERLGQKAIPGLVQALQDSRPRVRRRAVDILGKSGATLVEPELANMLYDPDRHVRKATVWALKKLGGACQVTYLTKAMQSSDKDMSVAAAVELGELADAILDVRTLKQATDCLQRYVSRRRDSEAIGALDKLATRLDVLELESLPSRDPLKSSSGR